jgi:hypothetical protein
MASYPASISRQSFSPSPSAHLLPNTSLIFSPAETTTTPPTFWPPWKRQIPCSILNYMIGYPPIACPAGCAPSSPAAWPPPRPNGRVFLPDISAVQNPKARGRAEAAPRMCHAPPQERTTTCGSCWTSQTSSPAKHCRQGFSSFSRRSQL